MENLFLFFKGLFIGLGKIIPGVSGSIIAVSLHVYEKAICAVDHLKDDFHNSLRFLIPLGLGILVAVLLFSNILLFFLTNFYVLTMFLFLGLIAGTIPSFRKQFTFRKKSNLFLFLLAFLLPFIIPLCSFSIEFSPVGLWSDYLVIIFMGFLDAATMIIPGISGTATFMMLGCYNYLLELFANPFQNIFYTICFGIGMLGGIFGVSKFVSYCLKQYANSFYIVVYGFLLSAIVSLFFMVVFQVTRGFILPSILSFGIGYFIIRRFQF